MQSSDYEIESLVKESEAESDSIVRKMFCDCRETILLIDSDVNQLTPLQYTLEHLYEISVHIAKDGEEGLLFYKGNATKKCCQTRYKLILIADSMPGKDGFQTAIEINELQEKYNKSNFSVAVVPIVAMT